MITKLLPENVTDNWDIVKHAIKESLPPFALDTPDKLNCILEAIILGSLEVWVYYDFEDSVKIRSIITTSLITDPESKTKNLLVYSIYNYDHTTEENWQEGYRVLNEYAKANNCESIIAYTKDPYILKFVSSIGGDTSIRFIKIPT